MRTTSDMPVDFVASARKILECYQDGNLNINISARARVAINSLKSRHPNCMEYTPQELALAIRENQKMGSVLIDEDPRKVALGLREAFPKKGV